MAKKTTSTKKTAKKKANKGAGRQNVTPKLTDCPYVANATRPHTTESSGSQATKLIEFVAAKALWTADVRKAYAGGAKKKDLPVFPTGKYVNPNAGILSRAAQDKWLEDFNDAIEAGRQTPAMLPRYNPILVDLIHAMNCKWLRRGSVAKHSKPPTGWDEEQYGNWYHEYPDGDGGTEKEPSGWFLDAKPPRRCHAETAEQLIDDSEKDVLTFGNLRIVCGTGTHDGSAAFMVHQTSHGNYRAGDVARKRMSLAGNKDVRNVVFKIEDKANNGGGFTVKGKWADVREMVYLPGQVLTAGYLYGSNGKVLDAKAIRTLDADTKGLRFKALDEPIVGKPISWERLWAEIQVDKDDLKRMRERTGRSEEYEVGDVETRAITNVLVHGKRSDPCELTPFGLRGSQIHMPAFIVADGNGNIEAGCFSMGVVIGARSNATYNVGVREIKPKTEKKASKPKKVEAPKPKKAEAPKQLKKAEAPKPKKVEAEPKTLKLRVEAPKPQQAEIPVAASPPSVVDKAPPVEADTADDDKPVEVGPVTE